jgi:non-heme chloroperoxidase
MPYFTGAQQVQLSYQDWGEGEPVVFLSGWALSSKMWQYQMIALVERGLRCVAYDRRGHGRSDDPGTGFDYDTLADDLAALLDTLDLSGVTLVGHSMAGGEIVRYLTRYGARRVARLALVAPLGPFPLWADDNPHGFDPATVARTRDRWKQDFTAWIEASAAAYVGRGLPGCTVSEGLVEWTRQDMLQSSLLALIECNRTAVETDLRPEMARLTLPTLIIDADHDQSIPTELSGMVCARLIRDSVFTLYENAPHGLYLTHADRLTADLAAFIAAPTPVPQQV